MIVAVASATSRRLAIGLALGFALAAYAWLAVGSGLDRATETRPDLARQVPSLLSSEALRASTREALAKGDGTSALRLSEAAVTNAPLDPTSTALLGAARYATGDRVGAERAFRVAARLGWRVAYTQIYMLGRALEVGDYRVAALRLDALARQNPGVLDQHQLFDPFERSAPGRSALADRLATAPPWLRPYAMAVHDLPPDRLAQRTAVLNEVAQRGKPVGCAVIGPTVSSLIAENQVADAARLWRGHCPAAAQSLLFDGNFAAAQLNQTESEFAWTFIGRSDASAVFEPDPVSRGRALVLDSTASRPEMMLRQLLLLPAGRYRLTWKAEKADGTPADGIVVGFSCKPDPSDWIAPQFDAASHRWQANLSMDTACPARWIGFATKGEVNNLRFSDVRLEPVR
ncbi:MAG: bacterial transcriptional activator domain-containing protein [Sphingomonadales bacterium]|nr:bacterial transcriptional activator domain-containing protein [Sphingomonadales bacterium]